MIPDYGGGNAGLLVSCQLSIYEGSISARQFVGGYELASLFSMRCGELQKLEESYLHLAPAFRVLRLLLSI
jgi:hypothetical protein